MISFLFPVIIGLFAANQNGNQTGVGYVFAFYSIVTFVSFFFYRKYLVETKGKSLEELEKLVLK